MRSDRQRLEKVVSRADLKHAKRIVIKAGTSTIVSESGFPSVSRIANVAEEIFKLQNAGKQVVFVSSGACGIGRNVLRRQDIMVSSAFDRLHRPSSTSKSRFGNNTAAAAGQANLMNLYQTIFSQLDITLAELLLTHHDFESDDRLENLQDALETLLSHGIVPIVNENDTVTANRSNTSKDPFTDNDGLAALVAQSINADLLVMLTDVDGLYDRPPSNPNARLITTYAAEEVEFGEKSSVGRGGMNAKIVSATRAVSYGIPAVCICSGHRMNSITDFLAGKPIGTLFVENPQPFLEEELATQNAIHVLESTAAEARTGSLKLNALTSEERCRILNAVADTLDRNRSVIFEANQGDLRRAKITNCSEQIVQRLELTDGKLNTLIDGIRSLSYLEEPIGKVLMSTQLDEGLLLQKEAASIGVLLVVVESRPDVLPQIAALALRSGNGLLLKGGHEAEKSNTLLHKIITDAVFEASEEKIPKGVIGLVTSRDEVHKLLKLEGYIDLVIPRGSAAMVRNIQQSTNIPVLGHADGICHVYVHSDADMAIATSIILDAKLNYPSSCNAAETLLVNKEWVQNGKAKTLIETLKAGGIKFMGGAQALATKLADKPVTSFHTEYGNEQMTLEVVEDLTTACNHINTYGSHHTDVIVTSSEDASHQFERNVDSACVFHNASTRFADGYRFGLGAEVGISTGRIHARGPVGVEGLMTQKWVLRSLDGKAATVQDFQDGKRRFKHSKLLK